MNRATRPTSSTSPPSWSRQLATTSRCGPTAHPATTIPPRRARIGSLRPIRATATTTPSHRPTSPRWRATRRGRWRCPRAARAPTFSWNAPTADASRCPHTDYSWGMDNWTTNNSDDSREEDRRRGHLNNCHRADQWTQVPLRSVELLRPSVQQILSRLSYPVDSVIARLTTATQKRSHAAHGSPAPAGRRHTDPLAGKATRSAERQPGHIPVQPDSQRGQIGKLHRLPVRHAHRARDGQYRQFRYQCPQAGLQFGPVHPGPHRALTPSQPWA